MKVGFSKFAELHPPYCVLAGASGTHSVCICTIHQNVKLLFESIKLYDLETTDGLSVQSYQHCIAQAVCNPLMPSCYLGICEQCPGCFSVQTLLQNLFDDNMIDMLPSSSGFQWTGLLWKPFPKQQVSLLTFL